MSVEFKCGKCGRVVSFEQYKIDRFCPSCGTFLRRGRRLRHWLFQFNPTIYRWFCWIKENNEIEQWLTSRHARKIQKGDKAVVWASGGRAGIYALGEIEEDPSRTPLNPEQEKYWIKKADVYKFQKKNSVTIRYTRIIIDRPLLETECSKDPILSNMEILKQPQGTNFPLTNEQWDRILEMIK